MIALWLYANLILPALVVGLGYLAMRANQRSVHQGHHGPAE